MSTASETDDHLPRLVEFGVRAISVIDGLNLGHLLHLKEQPHFIYHRSDSLSPQLMAITADGRVCFTQSIAANCIARRDSVELMVERIGLEATAS